MTTTFLAMGIALLGAIGLVITLGLLSLASGAGHFLFGKPRFGILKSSAGETGLAFSFKWNSAKEIASFDHVRLRLFNPFGTPTQVQVTKKFGAMTSSFAQDIDMGPAMKEILTAKGMEEASVEIEVFSSKDGLNHTKLMNGKKFLDMMSASDTDAQSFNDAHALNYKKPVFTTSSRSFIAESLPQSNMALKIATNPEFAGDFTQGADAGEVVADFTVSKVWIEEGCIICDACSDVIPEVFDVLDSGCVIKADAPLDKGLAITEAAEVCPVEIIKFTA